MKKVLLILVLSMIGVISCSSCAKKNQVVYEIAPPAVDASLKEEDSGKDTGPSTMIQAVSGDKWSFSLPSQDWHSQNSDAGFDVMMANDELKNLVIFGKEAFVGTLQDYSTFALRSIRESGGNIVSSLPVVVNNNHFILIESMRENIVIYQWLAVQNGIGYNLSCGGPSSPKQKIICDEIISTLKIGQ